MNTEIQKMPTLEKAFVTAKIIRASIRRHGLTRQLFSYLHHATQIIAQAENPNEPIIDALDSFRDFMLRLKGKQLKKGDVSLFLANLDSVLSNEK